MISRQSVTEYKIDSESLLDYYLLVDSSDKQIDNDIFYNNKKLSKKGKTHCTLL